MSVLIKGMEMPTACGKCKIKNAIKCNRWELVRSVLLDRHRDCPLVPVPPHGDLIDRDALLDTATIHWSQTTNESCFPIDEIEYAPIIIPADGKDTDVPTREEEV